MDEFSAPVRAWFETTFSEPTGAQAKGWPAIAAGEHSLILAPTGSGKTLSAFLFAIDTLMTSPVPEDKERTRVLYISPLRALAVDVEKNLRSPIQGISLAAERLGETVHLPTVAIRSGDTPADQRRRLVRHPPDVLITTPESLYLMLTSKARETLTSVQYVIIDEIHAMAGTKRGAHLALSLERLTEITAVPPQRIGLSATQRPLEEIARFLGGSHDGSPRDVTIVDAGITKELDLEVIVPIEDMGALGEVVNDPVSSPISAAPARRSIWPSMHPRLLELVQQHRSTLIFVNSRRLAERLAAQLNDLDAEQQVEAHAQARRAGPDDDPLSLGDMAAQAVATWAANEDHTEIPLVRAHHGSLSRHRRLEIEDQLKSGQLKGLVCTSSLELGIDMGAVDLVVQVESPRSVASGLQRIGRAGHQVGEASTGKVFPKHRSDLIEATVVSRQMKLGNIEHTSYPRNPLDVLAQQIVAMCALDDWKVADLARVVRQCANFADLSDDVLNNVLDLLSGRYPSESFGELRPRVVWDRVEDTLRGRAGAQRLAVTNAGTIPDRGLFGVFLPDGTRVGELDEEMVYESRPGETFLLGASTWRIEDITFERVVVTPAPGEPGKMPFWRGDGPGRPYELGQAVGEFLRTIREIPEAKALKKLESEYHLDTLAAGNVLSYLDDQVEVSGTLPDDRTIVIERFRDEIGDWRICILSPFGAQVHAPWAMVLQGQLQEEFGQEVELLWSDDGIVLRLPEAFDSVPLDQLIPDLDRVDAQVVSSLPNTAMFAARFRECAARSLLLPRRRPDQRTPLWQQRQRAADLLTVAAGYDDFPILLEATRECLNDVFDMPGFRSLLRSIRSREVRVVTVDTPKASPFAQSLLFGWIAVYMYEGDAPLAERRATALSLDRDLLRDLLGAEELRELIDAGALADLELELQKLVDGRRARDTDEVHDLLRALGPLTAMDVAARVVDGVDAQKELDTLVHERRAIQVGIADRECWAAAEDASRLRDALGVALPPGLPGVFTESVERPLHDLASRYARTHGPFLTRELAGWMGIAEIRLGPVMADLLSEGVVTVGEFRPGGREREWCDQDVLRVLRRRSLAILRKEVEPVDQSSLARFLPSWQGVGSRWRGPDGVADALAVLEGMPLLASAFEADILPARVQGYRSADLDELCTTGEVVWAGAGGVGAKDGRIRLVFREHAPTLLVPPDAEFEQAPVHEALLGHLEVAGASFWPDLLAAVAAAGAPYDDAEVLTALWDLVWAGHVTNDSLAPLRAYIANSSAKRAGKAAGSAAKGRRGRPRPGRISRVGPPAGAGRWSLTKGLLLPAVPPTVAAHGRALQLLERYGVVTREAVLAEGSPGGYAGVYPVLKALEDQGKVRRGYFVEGLGAAQFALAGAVDRLRDHREHPQDPEVVLLGATDPAQPYGAALNWPESPGRPSRSAGAHLLMAGGVPVVYLERGGKSLATFAAAEDWDWVAALKGAVESRRIGPLELTKIDGEPAPAHPAAQKLLAAGFTRGYRGLSYRPNRR